MKSQLITIVSLVLCASALAESPAKPQGRDLSISPSAVRSPARKYRLIVDPLEATAGNAASIYQSVAIIAAQFDDAATKRLEELLELPLDELPKAEVADMLRHRAGMLDHIDTAARRERCDWDHAIREQSFSALLPHLGPLRIAAKLVALRSRLAIAEQRWADAAHSICTGYALAGHMGEGYTLIEALVAIGIGELTSTTVLDWINAPESPNLYWALNELPAGFVDIPACLRRERAWGLSVFPSIQQAIKGDDISSEQWHQGITRLSTLMSEPGNEAIRDSLGAATTSAMLLVPARAYLLANGYTQEKLNTLQPAQIVARYVIDNYLQTYDDLTLWYSQPFWIAMPHIRDAEGLFQSISFTANPLRVLIPATSKSFESSARAQRTRVMLLTLEAIRSELKATGKLPAKLEDLGGTPVPIDPITGRLPGYEPASDGFVLSSPEASAGKVTTAARFEVKIRK